MIEKIIAVLEKYQQKFTDPEGEYQAVVAGDFPEVAGIIKDLFGEECEQSDHINYLLNEKR